MEWESNWFWDEWPSTGLTYDWDTGTNSFVPASPQPSGTHGRDESSEDWWYSHTNVYQGGLHVGYAACGFTRSLNWGWPACPNGCFGSSPSNSLGSSEVREFETQEIRRGDLRAVVGLFDLNGSLIDKAVLAVGDAYDIKQDGDGNFVITGSCRMTVPTTDIPFASGVTPQFSYLADPGDPALSFGGLGVSCGSGTGQVSCAQRQLAVYKLDPNLDILWVNMYNIPSQANAADALAMRSQGQSVDLAPWGYRIVGWGWPAAICSDAANRPIVLDLDANGNVIRKRRYDAISFAGNDYILPTGNQYRALAVSGNAGASSDRYLITGFTHRQTLGQTFSAWFMELDNTATDPLAPVLVKDLLVDAEYTPHAIQNDNFRRHFSTSIGYASNGDIIWPVLVDTRRQIFAGSKEATAKVFRIDASNPATLSWVADLGPVRAYDLQMGHISLADGNIAIVTSKMSPNGVPTYADVQTDVGNCLINEFPGYNWQYTPSGNVLTTEVFEYWDTDVYVAKINATNGQLIWDLQHDEAQGNPRTCPYPAPTPPDWNLKRGECVYKITETSDGGLVVSGNSGSNFDDAYLCKISNCDLSVDFSSSPVLDGNGEHHITGTVTWSSTRNIIGSIVVDPGATLTINNGTMIHFADSRATGVTTNIVVQPGGTLNVMSGATLTSLAPCENSMWDGIMALGNTNLNQSPSNQGTVQITTGATVENALVGVLAANADINDPIASAATQRGARVICTNATFKNNIYDVVLRPYFCANGSGCTGEQTVTKFWECDFLTTSELNYVNETPRVHVYVNSYPRIWVRGCTFDGTHAGLDVSNVAAWGIGIESFNTDLRIEPWNSRNPVFTSLQEGVVANNPNAKNARVTGASFTNCGHGVGIWGASPAHVVNSQFVEPDLDLVGQGLGAPVYGTYLDGTSVILFEDNSFIASGSPFQNPGVGSTFKDIGPNNNRFFNNTYSGFTGNNGGFYSAGVTIQGDNDGPLVTDGLHFKCNDFSWFLDDDFDMAFTGPNVSVGNVQGSNTDAQSPAGNTFLQSCTGNDEHMQVDDVPNNLGLYFQYWHHAPTAGVEVVPTCLTNPPLDPTPLTGINQPTLFTYSKQTACGIGTMMMLSGGGSSASSEAASSAAEQATLRAVYDDWTDGGNTDGLQDFVQNPANGSYAIRNHLMLVAPKVSSGVWELVFDRLDDMNPWHMAQALIANSPLEPEVYRLMEESALTPYYKQLVANEQGGGINMQTLMESEMAYWMGRQSQALLAYTSLAMDSASGVSIADAIALHQQYPVPGSDQQVYLLHLADGDLANARSNMNAALTTDHDSWWDLQDLCLSKLEAGEEAGALSAAEESALNTIAAGGGQGGIHASAWLAATNSERPVAHVVLPTAGLKMFLGGKGTSNATLPELLGVYPNPTKGEAFVTYALPEGAETGWLEVRDALGRLVFSEQLNRSGGIVELRKDQLDGGLYAVTLRADGILVSSAKFIALR